MFTMLEQKSDFGIEELAYIQRPELLLG